MGRRLVILPQADLDLEEHCVFIGQDNPTAATHLQRAVRQAFDDLLQMPQIGTKREFASPVLKDLRYWLIPGFRNYLIFYRPIDEGVEIVRVLHGARDIEGIFTAISE